MNFAGVKEDVTGPAANIPTNPREREADLICEALVKEIGRGGRWCAIVDAWQALLTVRRMAKNMEAERIHLSGGSAGVAGGVGAAHSLPGMSR